MIRGGGVISYVWEFIVVICAGVAVITNMLVISSIYDCNDRASNLYNDMYRLEHQVDMNQHYLDVINEQLAELQAQVKYGLAERYDIETED